MDQLIDRLKHVVEFNCQEIIDPDHPLSVECVGTAENLVCEVACDPGDEGLFIGAPGRPRTDSDGHTRVAAVFACEKPLPAAVTRVVLAADEAIMAGEGMPHD